MSECDTTSPLLDEKNLMVFDANQSNFEFQKLNVQVVDGCCLKGKYFIFLTNSQCLLQVVHCPHYKGIVMLRRRKSGMIGTGPPPQEFEIKMKVIFGLLPSICNGEPKPPSTGFKWNDKPVGSRLFDGPQCLEKSSTFFYKILKETKQVGDSRKSYYSIKMNREGPCGSGSSTGMENPMNGISTFFRTQDGSLTDDRSDKICSNDVSISEFQNWNQESDGVDKFYLTGDLQEQTSVQNEDQILARINQDIACRKSSFSNRKLSRRLSEHSECDIPEKRSKMSFLRTSSVSDGRPASFQTNSLFSSSMSSSSSSSSLESTSGGSIAFHDNNSTSKLTSNSSSSSLCAPPSTKQQEIKSRRYKKTREALQGSGLLHITMKTAELMKKNHKLQKDIGKFKQDVISFLQDVMKNPENEKNEILKQETRLPEKADDVV